MLELRKSNPLTYRAVYLFDEQQKLLLNIDYRTDELNTIDLKINNDIEVRNNVSNDVLMVVKAAAKGVFSVSDFYIVEPDLFPVIDMAIPIKLTESILKQIIVIQIDLRSIWKIVDQFQFGHSATAFICSKNGLIIAHPDRRYIGSKIAPSLEPVLAGFEGTTEYRDPITGTMLLASYSPTGKRPGWGVVVYQEHDKIFAQSNRLLLFTAVVVLASILVGTGITAIIARSITRPIKELVKRTQLIGRTGNLDCEMNVSGRDEVGKLADSFSQMIASLKKQKLHISGLRRNTKVLLKT